jgi:class I fructose-bisphosphate aldolase
MSQNYASIIGDEKANLLLNYKTPAINKSLIHMPNEDFVSQIWSQSNRNIPTLRSLQQLYGHGRLANTGYMSILPVDQGIEHSAGASFAPNPIYFDSENIVKLAMEAGCNAVASTYGVLGSVARKYAHKIPFIVKINHNEFLSYPNTFDQVMFGTIKSAWEMGAVAVGATIYFGSEESRKQLVAVAEAFEYAHQLGMATVLWCYTRNNAFKVDGIDYHASADLSGQANHSGRDYSGRYHQAETAQSNNGGYKATKHGKTHEKVYTELTTDNPIDLCRYQVANCYMGQSRLDKFWWRVQRRF